MLGFNRYIVECKLRMIIVSTTGGMSFNRYIVECKLMKNTMQMAQQGVLIDT